LIKDSSIAGQKKAPPAFARSAAEGEGGRVWAFGPAGLRPDKPAIAFTDRTLAAEFERFLKSASGRAFSKKGLCVRNPIPDSLAPKTNSPAWSKLSYNSRVETVHQNGGNQTRPCPRGTDASEQPRHMITNHSLPATKVKLFRSLFRGREDVYPRRFESRKTGKSGYAPACANEWVRGICEKPRIKCTDCPNRQFLQITDEVIGWHLSGRDARGLDFVMGVYAMLLILDILTITGYSGGHDDSLQLFAV